MNFDEEDGQGCISVVGGGGGGGGGNRQRVERGWVTKCCTTRDD